MVRILSGMATIVLSTPSCILSACLMLRFRGFDFVAWGDYGSASEGLVRRVLATPSRSSPVVNAATPTKAAAASRPLRGESGSPRGVLCRTLVSLRNRPSPSSGPEDKADPSGPSGWRTAEAVARQPEGGQGEAPAKRPGVVQLHLGSFHRLVSGLCCSTRGGPSGLRFAGVVQLQTPTRPSVLINADATLGPGSDPAPGRDPTARPSSPRASRRLGGLPTLPARLL